MGSVGLAVFHGKAIIQRNAQIENSPMIADWPDEMYLTKQMFLPNNPVMRFHALWQVVLTKTHEKHGQQ